MKKNLALVGVVCVLLLALTVGYLLYERASSAFDERLLHALSGVQGVSTYEARVETKTVISERQIDILGLYRLNFGDKAYGSFATTTLTIPDEPVSRRRHTFTLNNVSIEDDIYLQIDTESSLLQKTIPYSVNWRHFKAAAIPPQFKDIAVSGPVLDNLALLSKNGAYLSPIGPPEERQLEGERFSVYPLRLSSRAQEVKGGTLQSLIGRISTGTVSVWIDDAQSVRLITINGDNYMSTTTILGVNIPLQVLPPHGVE